MEYDKIVWQDYPNTTTPINAENLNHMEEGIATRLAKQNPTGDGSIILNKVSSRTYGSNVAVFGTGNGAANGGGLAYGDGNKADGWYSMAGGTGCTASGTNSQAVGYSTTATGQASSAEGYNNYCDGSYSHAEGYSNTIGSNVVESHVEGLSNSVNGSDCHAEGQSNSVYGSAWASHVEGYGNGMYGGNSHAEGSSNSVYGSNNHAEGYNNKMGDSTYSPSASHVEGSTNTVMASDAHAEGYGNFVYGGNAHAEGGNNKATSYCSHAEGYNTTAAGEYSHAQGKDTTAGGESSFASGYKVTVSGNYSGAVGYGLTTERPSTFAVGKFNLNNGALFSVGNGNNDEDRKNVFWVQDNGFIYAEDIFIMCKNSLGEKSYTPLGMAFMDGEKPGMWNAINDIAGRLTETVQIEGSTYNNQIGFGFDVATSSLKVIYKYYEYDESQSKAVRKTKYYKIAMEEYEPEE